MSRVILGRWFSSGSQWLPESVDLKKTAELRGRVHGRAHPPKPLTRPPDAIILCESARLTSGADVLKPCACSLPPRPPPAVRAGRYWAVSTSCRAGDHPRACQSCKAHNGGEGVVSHVARCDQLDRVASDGAQSVLGQTDVIRSHPDYVEQGVDRQVPLSSVR